MPDKISPTPENDTTPSHQEEEFIPEHIYEHRDVTTTHAGTLNPNQPNPQQIIQLQRIHGNQYVSRLMQRQSHPKSSKASTAPYQAQFTINDKIQRLQNNPDDPTQQPQDEDTNPQNTSDNNTDSQSQVTSVDSPAHPQLDEDGIWGDLKDTVENSNDNLPQLSLAMQWLHRVTNPLRSLGIGLPITATLADLSSSAQETVGNTQSNLQQYLSRHEQLDLDLGPASTDAWGDTLDQQIVQLSVELDARTSGASSNIQRHPSDILHDNPISEEARERIDQLKAKQREITYEMSHTAEKTFNAVTESEQLQTILQATTEAPETIKDTLTNTAETLGDQLSLPDISDIPNPQELLGTVKDVAEDAKETPNLIMRTPKVNVSPTRQSVVQRFFGKIVDAYNSVDNALKEGVSSATSFVSGSIDKYIFNPMRSIMSRVTSYIAMGIKYAANFLKTLLRKLWEAIDLQNRVRKLLEAIRDKVVDHVQKEETYQEVSDKLIDFYEEQKERVDDVRN